jgi:hypothetical protein
MDHRAAGGGLGEYYSEGDTRAPGWLVAGDRQRVADLTGLSAGAVQCGCADTAVVARWLDDGVAPNGAAGRAFRADGVHGFDLTFAAPKSVSLVRALGNEVAEMNHPGFDAHPLWREGRAHHAQEIRRSSEDQGCPAGR